jgi:hypothetical protein
MTAHKPFAAERLACNRVLRDVARLWRRYEPELRRLVREGRYEDETLLRQRLFREQDHLRQEWMAIRRSMPPFVERRPAKRPGGSVDYLHPVTPENAHLLRPQYLKPLTSPPPPSTES